MMAKLSPLDVKQVMFIRLGAVGDLMVATAALQETLERFPNASVWVAGHPFWMQLLIPSRWPRINGVIPLDAKTKIGQMHLPDLKTESWISEGAPQPIRQFLKSCDASINLRHESVRYAWPAWSARVPIRMGTCWWGLKWLYTHWEPWLDRDPILHERDRLLRIATAPPRRFWPLGFAKTNRRRLKLEQTCLCPGEKVDKWTSLQRGQDPKSIAFQWRSRVLPKLKEPDTKVAFDLTGRPPQSYILVNPTGSRRDKAWLASQFYKLCVRLKPWLRERGQELIVVGAPKETEWLLEVAGGHEFKVVQPSNLRQLLDLVGCSTALLTTASSMQFFANSVNVPTMVLMGRTFAARWGPLRPHDKVIWGVQDPTVTNMYEQDIVAYNSITVDTVESEFKKFAEPFLDSRAAASPMSDVSK